MSYREKQQKNSSDPIKHRCFHSCLQRSRQRAPLSCRVGSNCTTTGILAELFEAFDCATLASLGRPGPMLAASPCAAGVPLASAAEKFDVRRALSAQFRGESCPAEPTRPIAGSLAHLK